MTRLVLTLSTFGLLALNGSVAWASVPASRCAEVCALPLAMLTPPPPRPVGLLQPVTPTPQPTLRG